LSRLLTHPIEGLENFGEILPLLGAEGAIKVFMNVTKSGELQPCF
jgi:hypothetical protein